MTENRKALIEYRLTQARDSIREADVLDQSGFDREFVKPGTFPKEMSKVLHRAFELRQKGDYMEETEVTVDDVAEIRPVAEQFVESAEQFLLGGN